jgi:hypothetical protein
MNAEWSFQTTHRLQTDIWRKYTDYQLIICSICIGCEQKYTYRLQTIREYPKVLKKKQYGILSMITWLREFICIQIIVIVGAKSFMSKGYTKQQFKNTLSSNQVFSKSTNTWGTRNWGHSLGVVQSYISRQQHGDSSVHNNASLNSYSV